MNNSDRSFDPCGIEVSFRTLMVALGRHDQDEPRREFPNTPSGHQGALCFLARSGRAVRVCLESTGLYGLDLALSLMYASLLRTARSLAVPRLAPRLIVVRPKAQPSNKQRPREANRRMFVVIFAIRPDSSERP